MLVTFASRLCLVLPYVSLINVGISKVVLTSKYINKIIFIMFWRHEGTLCKYVSHEILNELTPEISGQVHIALRSVTNRNNCITE